MACRGEDGAGHGVWGEMLCVLLVMGAYKAEDVCQNSLNCTLQMNAFYCMKLCHDEVDLRKRKGTVLALVGSVGERCNSGRDSQGPTDCGKGPAGDVQGLGRHLAREPRGQREPRGVEDQHQHGLGEGRRAAQCW